MDNIGPGASMERVWRRWGSPSWLCFSSPRAVKPFKGRKSRAREVTRTGAGASPSQVVRVRVRARGPGSTVTENHSSSANMPLACRGPPGVVEPLCRNTTTVATAAGTDETKDWRRGSEEETPPQAPQ